MQDPIYSSITECRICRGDRLEDVISLGDQVITSRFPKMGDFTTPVTPIDLCLCSDCGLLQLRQRIISSELYEHEYGYRSGISNTMKAHLKQYNDEIVALVSPQEGDVILDIGSNDSTMLQYYSPCFRRIGMDPTGKQFRDFYVGGVELVEDYFTKTGFQSVYGEETKCKIVSSISMFYDLPDPVQFAKDIHDILADDGVWTCEQSYMISMLEKNSFDTICHEHLEYYGLHQIAYIADMSDMKILDVKFNECNGGSFRIYFCKKSCDRYPVQVDHIENILNRELCRGLFDKLTYVNFMERCKREMDQLTAFIDSANQEGKRVWIYGASTKGNCLLQYAGIGAERIQYAVERNPEKIGKMTVTGIEIISEETMRANPPEYLLVLPWHFRDEIIRREDAFLKGGGKLIFPLPNFEIYGTKKVLITGCDGHIASYYIDLFHDKYDLYGISRKTNGMDPRIKKYEFDLHDTVNLESVILGIKPDIILHLAGMSSSVEAFHNPVDAIETNGMITVHLCDIIHRHRLRTVLFNASSSEIYKGYGTYRVEEYDADNPFHHHPYSIGKILGQSTVEFYRETYGLPFSNGILFTVESNRKRGNFLLNKVAAHAKSWTESSVPLVLGSLESYRNIMHASDAARAIDVILSRPAKAEKYVVSNTEGSMRVKDLVLAVYELCGIALEERANRTFYKRETDILVFRVENAKNGLDDRVIDIRGYPGRLVSLGWKPEVTVKAILEEIVEAAP